MGQAGCQCRRGGLRPPVLGLGPLSSMSGSPTAFPSLHHFPGFRKGGITSFSLLGRGEGQHREAEGSACVRAHCWSRLTPAVWVMPARKGLRRLHAR